MITNVLPPFLWFTVYILAYSVNIAACVLYDCLLMNVHPVN